MSKETLCDILIVIAGRIQKVEKEIEMNVTEIVYPLGKLVALLDLRSVIQNSLIEAHAIEDEEE